MTFVLALVLVIAALRSIPGNIGGDIAADAAEIATNPYRVGGRVF